MGAVRMLPKLAALLALGVAGAVLAAEALGAPDTLRRPWTAAATIALALALLSGGGLGRALGGLAAVGGIAGLVVGRMGPYTGVAIVLLGAALTLLERPVSEPLSGGAAASV